VDGAPSLGADKEALEMVLGRLFLLFLLACDYAGDPYFGHSPLSRPLSSQTAYCCSLDHQTQLSKECRLELLDSCQLQLASLDVPHLTLLGSLPESKVAVLPTSDHVYLLMSIRR
jgi:hypothetical protein